MKDLLGAILNAQSICSHCESEPAFIRVDEKTVACPTCWTGIDDMINQSPIASGLASSGEKVTAPADLPPNSRPGSFTDPFDSSSTTFRNRALNSIEPKAVQVSSSSNIPVQHNQ